MEKNIRESVFRSRFFSALKYIVLAIAALVSLAPLFWVFLSAFKTNSEIIVNSFSLPRQWLLDNYMRAFSSPTMLRAWYNSIVNVVLVLGITLLFGSMAAYVSSRLTKGALQTFFAFDIMIPMQSILVPTFLILKDLNLIYSRPGMILAYSAASMPITVFVLHGFMKGIPREMEEAAIIDGCSRSRCFFSIIFPMSKPGLATVLTLNLLTVWNDYLVSLVIGGKKELYNLTVTINSFRTEFTADYGMICAFLMFGIIPLIILFVLLQENVIKGMAAGAVKG